MSCLERQCRSTRSTTAARKQDEKQAKPQEHGQQPQRAAQPAPQQHAAQPAPKPQEQQRAQQSTQQQHTQQSQPSQQARQQPQPQRIQQQARSWQQQKGWAQQGGGLQGHATFAQDRSQNWSSDHRTRAQVRGCRPGDGLQFSASAASRAVTALRPDGTSVTFPFPAPLSPLPGCDDFLVRDLPPGSYEFALQSKCGWALTPVEIVNKNLFVMIAMVPEADVAGTVITAHDDMSLPAFDHMRILLDALPSSGLPTPPSMSSVSGGKFLFQRVRGPQRAVVLSGFGSGYYVKEIRANGVVAPDGIVTPGPGLRLEVVIDDQPATLAGAVTDGGKPSWQPKVYVSRWPLATRPLPGMLGAAPAATGNVDGRFQIAGLPPGEYRVPAVPSGPIPDGASDWNITPQLWDRAERVTLERGKQKEIVLKLADPFLDK